MKQLFRFSPARFVRGFSAYFKGYRFIIRQRSLWRYSLLPGLLNCLVFAGVVVLVFNFAGKGFNRILALLGANTAWYWVPVRIILIAALVIVGYNLLIILYNILANIVCGPFNAILAGKVYRLRMGRPLARNPWGDFLQIFRDIGFEIRFLFYSITVNLLLLLLNLLPAVGSLLYVLRSHYFTFTLLGWPHLCRPAAMQGHTFQPQRRLVMERRSLCAGFGAAVFLLMFVPVINLLVMPGSVSGGVLLYCEEEENGTGDRTCFSPAQRGTTGTRA